MKRHTEQVQGALKFKGLGKANVRVSIVRLFYNEKRQLYRVGVAVNSDYIEVPLPSKEFPKAKYNKGYRRKFEVSRSDDQEFRDIDAMCTIEQPLDLNKCFFKEEERGE